MGRESHYWVYKTYTKLKPTTIDYFLFLREEDMPCVTVKNIPTREIIPPVYFRIRKSVKNILGVCFCIRQYVMSNTYDML